MLTKEESPPDNKFIGLPCPLPDCPKCGKNSWKFQVVPGHAQLQQSLMDFVEKLTMGAIGFGLGSLLVFYAPAVQKVGYLCLGVLVVEIPLIFFVMRWLIPKISPGLEICQECGFTVKAGEILFEK